MSEDHQLGLVLDLLVQVAEAFVAMAGPTCEVVVYDLRTPQHKVHGVSGGLSGLSAGDHTTLNLPPEIISLEFSDAGTQQDTLVERGFQSSTVWIRDVTGQVGGAITVKCDFSEIEAARSSLERILPKKRLGKRELASDSVGTVALDRIEVAVSMAIEAQRKSLRDFDRDDYVSVIHALDQAGLFAVRRSKDIVAHALGISRASVYAYLRASQNSVSSHGAH